MGRIEHDMNDNEKSVAGLGPLDFCDVQIRDGIPYMVPKRTSIEVNNGLNSPIRLPRESPDGAQPHAVDILDQLPMGVRQAMVTNIRKHEQARDRVAAERAIIAGYLISRTDMTVRGAWVAAGDIQTNLSLERANACGRETAERLK